MPNNTPALVAGWSTKQRRAVRTAALAAVALAALASQVPAATPTPAAPRSFGGSVEVPVVNLDVLVTDSDGAPVLDLKASDFQLSVDGEPVPLSHFAPPTSLSGETEPTADAAPQAGPTPVPAAEGRQYVIVFVDLTNYDRQRLRTGLDQVSKFLGGTGKLPVPVMVMSFDGRVRVCQSFTQNRDALLASLDCCRESSATRLDLGHEKMLMRRRISQVVAAEVPPSDPARETWERQVLELYYEIEQSFDEVARDQTEAVLEGLRHCVGMLAGIPGRKSIVLMSDGVDAHATQTMFEVWRGTFARIQVRRERELVRALQRVQPKSQGYPHATLELRQLVEAANAHRITFFTLTSLSDRMLRQISADTGTASSTEGAFAELTEEIVLYRMADLTGGRVLNTGPELANQLRKVSEELGQLYLLAFVPPVSNDGKFHRIQVSVAREGVTVSHRRGWRASIEDDQLVAKTLAAAGMETTDNPLGISVEEIGRENVESGELKVDIMVRVPISKLVLLPGAKTHDGATSLCLVIRDDAERLSRVYREAFPVAVPDDQLERALTSAAGFRKVLQIRKGGGVIAVGVRDDIANVVSTAVLRVAPESP